MLYIYVAINNGKEELVKTTSDHLKKWSILREYMQKAEKEHIKYKIRVVETRHTIYM